jgi:chemotaxis protein MotB
LLVVGGWAAVSVAVFGSFVLGGGHVLALLQPFDSRASSVRRNSTANHISIAGHTDALPYRGMLDGYSNWELSSERANAARRELLAGGMHAAKILQIRGLADALPFLKNDPANASNRRISIVVLNAAAEANFLRDGQQTAAGPAPSPAATP